MSGFATEREFSRATPPIAPKSWSLAYSVTSACCIGLAAGLPWAAMKIGLLPAFSFCLLASLQALAQWRRKFFARGRARGGGYAHAWGFGWGAFVGGVFGGPGSYTWPDANLLRCFTLNVDGPVGLFGSALVGAFSFSGASLLVSQLDPWRRARWKAQDLHHRMRVRVSMCCLLASIAWSLVDENIFMTWLNESQRASDNPIIICLGLIMMAAANRPLCVPEVGWIAVAGYATAAIGFVGYLRGVFPIRADLSRLIRGSHPRLMLDSKASAWTSTPRLVSGDGPQKRERGTSPAHGWTGALDGPNAETYRSSQQRMHGYVYGGGEKALALTESRLRWGVVGVVTALALLLLQCLGTGVTIRQKGWRGMVSSCGCERAPR